MIALEVDQKGGFSDINNSQTGRMWKIAHDHATLPPQYRRIRHSYQKFSDLRVHALSTISEIRRDFGT